MDQLFAFAASGPWQLLKDFLGNCLEWLFSLTMNMGVPSYVLAMFIFTVIVKILMQPLMNKQMRSTRRMQLLAPEIEELKRRYGRDQNKLNQETMRLYKENNCSPTAGCLPLLVQMPIIIALFQAIQGFVPAYPEYFSLAWVGGQVLDLNMPDPTKIILPLAAAGSTFLQQLISTANKQDKTQRMMLIMMPVMFFFFVRNFQSLLAFYWIFYSLIGAAIYVPIKRKWDKEDKAEAEERAAKRAAEEEAKRERKERAAAARKKAQRKPAQPGYEIQEGDFDEPELDEPDDDETDEDPEKAFRRWMKAEGVQTKTKRVRLHPYSTEDTIVELCFMKNGEERSVDELRAFWMKNVNPQPDPRQQLADMGSLFGFGRRKKKTQDQAEAAATETAPAESAAPAETAPTESAAPAEPNDQQ